MVDKVSKAIAPASSPKAKAHRKASLHSQNHASPQNDAAPSNSLSDIEQSTNQAITQKVMRQLGENDGQSESKLRRQIIFHTLTDLLGEKASREPKFMTLVEKIESVLANNPVSQTQVREVMKKLQSPR